MELSTNENTACISAEQYQYTYLNINTDIFNNCDFKKICKLYKNVGTGSIIASRHPISCSFGDLSSIINYMLKVNTRRERKKQQHCSFKNIDIIKGNIEEHSLWANYFC